MRYSFAPVMAASAVEAARQFREEQGWEVLAEFADLLRLPNQHAPDENVRNANLWHGIDSWATLLTGDFSSLRR